MEGLIDTNVLIYLSIGQLDFSILTNRYRDLSISRITHMEVLGYKFRDKKEEELVRELVGKFRLLEIDERVGEGTIKIRKSNRIKLPDAIIYATAMVNNCELVTANVKDFQDLRGEVKIFNPISK